MGRLICDEMNFFGKVDSISKDKIDLVLYYECSCGEEPIKISIGHRQVRLSELDWLKVGNVCAFHIYPGSGFSTEFHIMNRQWDNSDEIRVKENAKKIRELLIKSDTDRVEIFKLYRSSPQ